MDTAPLAAAVAVFTCGLIVGYLIRDGISRRRRAKAKISRSFFYEGRLATDNSYIEYLSAKDKIANPTQTVTANTPNEVNTTSKRLVLSFQRGASVAVPSEPPVV
jgi:hypothetical protein